MWTEILIKDKRHKAFHFLNEVDNPVVGKFYKKKYKWAKVKSNSSIAKDLVSKFGMKKENILIIPEAATAVAVKQLRTGFIELGIKRKNLIEKIKSKLTANKNCELFYDFPFLTIPLFHYLKKGLIFLGSQYFKLVRKKLSETIMVEVPSPQRFGHGVANVDVAIHEILNGLHGNYKTIIVFYKNVSNIYLKGNLKVEKPLFFDEFIRGCFLKEKNIIFLYGSVLQFLCLSRAIRRSGGKLFHMRTYGHRDIFNCLGTKNKFYKPSEICEKTAKNILKCLNFDFTKPTIVISNREDGNIKSKNNNDDKKRYNFRNSSLANLHSTIKWFCRNHNVVRIGSSRKKSKIKYKNFLDLTDINYDEKKICLEIYLNKISKFFIGTTSGNYAYAQLLRKPIVWTNTVPVGHYSSWRKLDISIFKIVKNKKTGKILPFKDLLKSEAGWMQHADVASKNFIFKENSPDEILNAAKEMDCQIMKKKSIPFSKINEEVIFTYPKDFSLYPKHRSIISPSFLKKYKFKLFQK